MRANAASTSAFDVLSDNIRSSKIEIIERSAFNDVRKEISFDLLYVHTIAIAQKTVPSLSMSIGGPPVSGRFCLAISRPPFQLALSRT
jgi:hypothetical protein